MRTLPLLKSWLSGLDAATAIEYSLIAAGIALAIAVVVASMGVSLNDLIASLPNAFRH